MKFGMNLLLWNATLDESLLPVLQSLKALGYDGVEIPLFDPAAELGRWASRLDDVGLQRTAVTVRGVEDNPISPDARVRALSVEHNRRSIDQCVALGCQVLAGPFYAALGHFSGAGPTPEEWQWGVDSLQPVAEYAAQAGVTLALEPLNRFEIYFLNGQADAARFARHVGHSCGVLYDTFHANIEEKQVGPALHEIADVLRHVHVSENDRSTPGQGNIRWRETFQGLREIQYDEWLVVEAFGLALPQIAAATRIWRRMYDSELELARSALQWMQRMALAT